MPSVEPKYRPNHASKSNADNLVRGFSKVLLAMYALYAFVHMYNGVSMQCNSRTIFLTMFPVRQVYTIPMIRSEVNAGMAQYIAEGDALAGLWGVALKGVLVDPILDLVANSDCGTIEAVLGNLSLDEPQAKSEPTIQPTVTPQPTRRGLTLSSRESNVHACTPNNQHYRLRTNSRVSVWDYDNRSQQLIRNKNNAVRFDDIIRVTHLCRYIAPSTRNSYRVYKISSPFKGYIKGDVLGDVVPAREATAMAMPACDPCRFAGGAGITDISANGAITLQPGLWTFSANTTTSRQTLRLSVLSQKPESCLGIRQIKQLPFSTRVTQACEFSAMVNALNGDGDWNIQLNRR